MRIEIAYAEPQEQWLRVVDVAPGTTAAEAIRESGLADEMPALELTGRTLGIFGEVCRHDTVLRPGDRVEIYRPLQVDPKTARRRRIRSRQE